MGNMRKILFYLHFCLVLSVLGLCSCYDHDNDKTSFSLITRDAGDINYRQATLKGNISVDNVEKPYSVGFFISEDGTPSAYNYIHKLEAGIGTKGDYSVVDHRLQPDRKYYYRAYVQHDDSLYNYGSVMSFTTPQFAPQPEGRQSVLVYIAGDCSLDTYVMDDVMEMMEGSKQLAEDCTLLLFIDRKGQRPFMLQVAEGDTIRLETFNEMKTSDATTLSMAAQWMTTNFPAKDHGLVLWGHADGWIIKNTRGPRRAYGQDTSSGEKWMDIPDMASALNQLFAANPLRFIFADCCCFQSVESAYELRRCAHYIIGSAAEIPGEGAPYETVIPALFTQADNFYKQAVDAYYEQVSYGYQEPLSVVRTSEMEQLAEATGTALKESLTQPDGTVTAYPNVNALIYYFDQTLFDMQDFMLRHASGDVFTQWKKAFDAAVPYKTMTTVWMSSNHVPYLTNSGELFRDFEITAERYGGVSMFVPQKGNRTNFVSQNNNINRMQWYTAAGLDKLGW